MHFYSITNIYISGIYGTYSTCVNTQLNCILTPQEIAVAASGRFRIGSDLSPQNDSLISTYLWMNTQVKNTEINFFYIPYYLLKFLRQSVWSIKIELLPYFSWSCCEWWHKRRENLNHLLTITNYWHSKRFEFWRH